MKTMPIRMLIATIAALLFVCGWSAVPAQTAQGGGKKILVAYFSRTGSTEEIAKMIQEQAGGDLFEARTVEPYPDDYKKCTEVAMDEQKKNARPALTAKVPDMAGYDVVFIGHPIWWGTMPMAVFTFLESYDFAGKTIVPFCTHAGSGRARSVDDIRRLCPNAAVAEGFVTRGSGASSAENEAAAWLRGLDIAK